MFRSATNCTYGNNFTLIYRDWMADKLENRQPLQEETQIFNHLLALQPHCNADLYPRALAACLALDPEFLAFFHDPDNRALDFQSNIERRPQSYTTLGLTIPQSRDTLISKTHQFVIFSLFSLFHIQFYCLIISLLSLFLFHKTED